MLHWTSCVIGGVRKGVYLTYWVEMCFTKCHQVYLCTIWKFSEKWWHQNSCLHETWNTGKKVPFQVPWKGLQKTCARRTNTANRASNMLMHHGHMSIPVCTISIMWNFHTNPYHFQWINKSKQQGDGAGEPSRTTNYELHGTGRATRAPVAQTLQTVRQTCSCTI